MKQFTSPLDGEKVEALTDFLFLDSKITADSDCRHKRKAKTNLTSILKKQRRYFADKGPYSQSCGFSSSNVWM